MQTHLVLETTMKKNSECETPATGTDEFAVWWESQYAPAESHNIEPITMFTTAYEEYCEASLDLSNQDEVGAFAVDATPVSNIEVVEGTSLELNTIFYELEQEAFEGGGDTSGK